MPLYRTLIVEDEPEWVDIYQAISRKSTFSEFDYRGTVIAARKGLDARPVHVVSLDQNLPAAPNEVPAAEIGFDLLEEIAATRPFIRVLMFSAYGKIHYANRAGRVGGTEYFQKKEGENQPDAIDVTDYFRLLQALTVGGQRPDNRKKEKGYIHWALGRAREHLPGMLGTAAGRLHDAQLDGFDHDKASKSLATLIERSAELAWVQACALAEATGTLPNGPLLGKDLESILRSLGRLWGSIDVARQGARQLGAWRGYITASSDSKQRLPAGERFLSALARLRKIRNRDTHGAIQALSPVDITEAEEDLLALVDGLAYWADRPLMHAVRLHPDDRARLQFQKIAGPGAWPLIDVKSDASPLREADRRTSIQILHRVGDKERLIDLFPFVSMIEQAGKSPIPALLLPTSGGFLRRSLATGEEIPNVPLRRAEYDALKAIFGSEWTR